MQGFRIIADASLAEHQQAHEEIVASQAFRTINLLIDTKTQRLIALMGSVQEQMAAMVKPLPPVLHLVDARTPQENGRTVAVPLDLHDLKFLTETIRACERLDAEISELQRFKVRLLNDLTPAQAAATPATL